MEEKTIKIKGYKQIGLDVFQFDKKNHCYFHIGKNHTEMPLPEYVDMIKQYGRNYFAALKEQLK